MKKKHNLIHYLVTVIIILVKSLIGSLVWVGVGATGYLIWQTGLSPYNLLFGLPLILVGIGLTLNNFTSVFLAIFSPEYNRGMCKFCTSKL